MDYRTILSHPYGWFGKMLFGLKLTVGVPMLVLSELAGREQAAAKMATRPETAAALPSNRPVVWRFGP